MPPFLPEGRRVYPYPTPLRVPGETLGLVRAAAASSPPPLLKVLLGMRRFDVLGAWWNSPAGAAVAGRPRFCRSADVGICFLLYFSFFPFGLGCAAASACFLYRDVAILI